MEQSPTCQKNLWLLCRDNKAALLQCRRVGDTGVHWDDALPPKVFEMAEYLKGRHSWGWSFLGLEKQPRNRTASASFILNLCFEEVWVGRLIAHAAVSVQNTMWRSSNAWFWFTLSHPFLGASLEDLSIATSKDVMYTKPPTFLKTVLERWLSRRTDREGLRRTKTTQTYNSN